MSYDSRPWCAFPLSSWLQRVAKICTVALAYFLAPTFAGAVEILSVNFTRNDNNAWVDESFMLPADEAGAPGVRAANWNNLEMGNREGQPGTPDNIGSKTGLVFATGAGSGAAVNWQTDLSDETLDIFPLETGDMRMFKGYLDVATNASVTFNNLPFTSAYDVYVYFDGNNGDNERTAQYTIGTETITGVDAAGADFHKTPNNNYEYRLIDPATNVGNYMVFSGVEGETFTLIAEGIAGNLMRAAIQGIQIVGDANVVVPGDVNGDGMVELDDYVVIRDNFRQLVTSRGMGDLSGDGQVNFVDFLEWRNSASEAVLAQFASYGQLVPEPAAWAIASLGVVLLGYSRWRR